MSTHYTAVIIINRTVNEPEVVDQYHNVKSAAVREVTELAKLEIRAGTVDALKERIAAHVELVEES